MRNNAAEVFAGSGVNNSSGTWVVLGFVVERIKVAVSKDRELQEFNPFGVAFTVGKLDDIAFCVCEMVRVTTRRHLVEGRLVGIALGLVLADFDITSGIFANKRLRHVAFASARISTFHR